MPDPLKLDIVRVPDMQQLAGDIGKAGARPGIWLRPLLTGERVPNDWLLGAGRFGEQRCQGVVLDPTVPETLEQAFTIAAERQPQARALNWQDTPFPTRWQFGEETVEYDWCDEGLGPWPVQRV
jgi:hypothetical protein